MRKAVDNPSLGVEEPAPEDPMRSMMTRDEVEAVQARVSSARMAADKLKLSADRGEVGRAEMAEIAAVLEEVILLCDNHRDALAMLDTARDRLEAQDEVSSTDGDEAA